MQLELPRQRARWELQVEERCVCGLFAARGPCLPGFSVIGEGMRAHRHGKVRRLAQRSRSYGCWRRCCPRWARAPRIRSFGPGRSGQLSLERGAAHRTQRVSAGGSGRPGPREGWAGCGPGAGRRWRRVADAALIPWFQAGHRLTVLSLRDPKWYHIANLIMTHSAPCRSL